MASYYNSTTGPPPKFDDDKQKERSDDAAYAWEAEAQATAAKVDGRTNTQLAKDKVSSTAFTSSDLRDSDAIPSDKEARYEDGPTEQQDEK